MLEIFNIENDNKTYRILFPSPSSIIPQHTIDVLGAVKAFRKEAIRLWSKNNNNRIKGRSMLVMFNIKNDNKTYRIPCLSTH